jgi:signal transduction histidine kinase
MRVERDAAGARIVVEDDGPGLPEEVRHRLFEPFLTTREVGEGMGLGLAITRGIAEEHGGELRLEEREGGGTRATIWLPAAEGGGQVA